MAANLPASARARLTELLGAERQLFARRNPRSREVFDAALGEPFAA